MSNIDDGDNDDDDDDDDVDDDGGDGNCRYLSIYPPPCQATRHSFTMQCTLVEDRQPAIPLYIASGALLSVVYFYVHIFVEIGLRHRYQRCCHHCC